MVPERLIERYFFTSRVFFDGKCRSKKNISFTTRAILSNNMFPKYKDTTQKLRRKY